PLTIDSKTDSHAPGYAGAFFSGSQNLSISGGTFTSHIHVTPPVQMDEFKKIARWEIDLRRETHMDRHLRAVSRGRAEACFLRVFSAKVQTNDSKSVMLYKGETAEEECRKYISRHANIWHPNVLQIFGLSSLGGKHAVIAQDDLVPYTEYLGLHRPSFILQAYLYVCWVADFTDIHEFRPQSTPNLTLWIRGSTGRLCLEFESRKMIGPTETTALLPQR
ncbi:hypothetical protein FB45DRAFT_933232, partial [Roridomyces roridus]